MFKEKIGTTIWLIIFYGICFLPILLICKFIEAFIPLPDIHANSDILLIVLIFFWWNNAKSITTLEERIIDLQKKLASLKDKPGNQ